MLAAVMADSSDSFQIVSVTEACRILNVSDSTFRRLLRAGRLEAQKVERPQGHVWLVKVPAPTGTSSEDPPNQLGVADSHPPAAPAADAMVSLIQTTIGTVLGPLIGELAASRQANEQLSSQLVRQAETIGQLRAENRALLASTAPQTVEPTTAATRQPVVSMGSRRVDGADDRCSGRAAGVAGVSILAGKLFSGCMLLGGFVVLAMLRAMYAVAGLIRGVARRWKRRTLSAQVPVLTLLWRLVSGRASACMSGSGAGG
jgi:excisionase family DNA binding protein